MKTSGKIRVLEVIRQGKVGGGETHLISLLENLNRSLFDPIVLSFTDGPMINRLNELGIQSYVIPTEQAFDFSIWAKVKHILKEKNIALVHIHGTRAFTNVLGPAKQLGIPIVYTVHGWSFHDGQPYWLRKMRIACERLFVRQARCTILVSQSDRITGNRYFGPFNSVVIRNGVALEKFSQHQNLQSIRSEQNIPNNVTLVGFIARITYQKNPLGMIEGFYQALQKLPNLRLLMVGEGDLKRKTIDRIKQLGIENSVHLTDFRQDVPAILNAIDIYCLPSLWEGLPIGLLEAMAAGRAVVATRVNGSKEVIEHEKNGLLIESRCPQLLADAIMRLERDKTLRKTVEENARRTVFKEYNVTRAVRATEEVYEQVLNKE